MKLTKIIDLLNHLNKDLVVLIAVEFVGGWKYKNNKLVFDFEPLYKSIPQPVYTNSKKFIYSRGFIYTIYYESIVSIPISIFKSYIISYIENQEYKEHEYTQEITIEGIKKIVVNKENGDINYSYYLDFMNNEINYFDTLYTEMT